MKLGTQRHSIRFRIQALGIGLFWLLMIAEAPSRAQLPAPDTLQWLAISPTRSVASLAGNWQLQRQDPPVAQSVAVPGIFQGAREVHLSRRFYLPDEFTGHELKLIAEGIHYDARIWINDRFIGGHRGGFSRFEIALDKSWLNFGGANRIRIESDGRLDAFYSLPPKHRPFGDPLPVGVHRELYLEALPPMVIDDIQARYDFAADYQQAEITLEVMVRKFSEDAAEFSDAQEWSIFAELRRPGEKGRVVALSQKVAFRMPNVTQKIGGIRLTVKSPLLWSPERPELYQLTVFLGTSERIVDMAQYRIGLRHIVVTNRYIQVNGAPFSIKAVDWVDDLSGLSGEALREKIDRLLDTVKHLGANTLRVIGRQPHPLLVQQCSERGLFILEEVPVFYANARQLAREQVLKLALNQLEETIQRDKLQPAVLAWGLGGYLQENDPRTEQFIDRMKVRARQLDDRPLYLVTRYENNTPANLAVDFLLVDLFEKDIRHVKAFEHDSRPILPIIGYMVNSPSPNSGQTEDDRAWIEMEEVQADRLQQALDFLTRTWPNYAGHVVHALADWQCERPALFINRVRPPYLFPAGLMTLDGRRRIGFQMVAAYHLQDRPPHISPTPNPAIHTPVFTIVGVAVILIFLFFLRRDKRLRGHLRRIFIHPHGFYMDIRENRKVPAFLTFLLGIIEGVIWGCIIAGWVWSLRDQLIFNEIIDLLAPSVALKEIFVWLAWNPGVLIAVVAALYLLTLSLFAVFLRIISMFRHESLPMIQYLTLMFWTGSNYIVLSPIAPIFYRLVEQPGFFNIGLTVVGLFFIWHMLRLYRGIRVLYLIPAPRAALILVMLLVFIGGGLIIYFQQTQAILDYFAYYQDLLK